jgi:Carboxypeptidase regulatory-like domain
MFPTAKRLACATLIVIGTAGMSTGVAGQRAELSGRVVDPLGCAVPTATVVVSDKSGVEVGTAATKEGGAYAISDLSPGPATVVVSLQGFASTRQAAVLSPGVNLLDTALLLGMRHAEPHSIAGTVRDARRQVLRGATISVLNALTNQVLAQTRTDSNGKYSVAVYDSTQFIVTASGSGHKVAVRLVDFPRDDGSRAVIDFRLPSSPQCQSEP